MRLNLPKIKSHSWQSGFTLVELLIVIVIIGILAGIVISVLNPLQQQRRAKDGVTKAQIDKMAISAKSLFVSSPRKVGRSPTLTEIARSFASSSDITTNCTDANSAATISCLFTIDFQPLPTNCDTNGYSYSTGSTQCSYIFWRSPDEFTIVARGMATPLTTFVYYYREDLNLGNIVEGFYACPVDFTVGAGIPATCERL